jgi:Cell division protein CrgA
VATTPKRPGKHRVEGGRVTPKGGPSKDGSSKPASGRGGSKGSNTPEASTRYTPRVPTYQKVSPPWVPVLMFGFMGLGILMIVANYLQILPGSVTNWYVFGGLGLILAGIITATQYR